MRVSVKGNTSGFDPLVVGSNPTPAAIKKTIGEIIMEEILTKVCSKCGKEKPITEYHKNGFDSKGNQKYRGYCKTCANNLEKERYRKKKTFLDSFKHKCEKCGDERPYVLDFHHRDKADKDFTIGKLKKGSSEVLKSEIDKCVVLCSNCHREFHYLERKENLTLEEYL